MPRKRTVESDDARSKRLKGKALRAIEDSTTEDADLDAMVKRSIALYGA
jgi:hypothetical protein